MRNVSVENTSKQRLNIIRFITANLQNKLTRVIDVGIMC